MNGRGRTSHSKGCNTCKKRKVKCDERQPYCLRCEKSKRKCLGYERPLIFITSSDAVPSSRESSPSSCTTIQCTRRSQIYHQSYAGLVSRSHHPIGTSIPLNGFQEDMVISHLLAKLYRPPTSTVPQAPGDTGLIDVLVHGGRRSAAFVAMLSVGEAFFGRINGLVDMITDSRSHYLEALHCIQEELAVSSHLDRGSMRWLAGLWGCSFLGMYEMMCSSSPTAWIQHSRGLAALTEAAGPEAFQSPSTNMMLKINRSFIAVGCIARRKRSFLERHDWQTIPWAPSTSPKSTWIRIQDILCQIPGLMEDFDALDVDDKASSSLSDLPAKILATLSDFDQLRGVWNMENPDARYCVGPRGRESPFTSTYHFQTFNQASESIHFDVITLLLYGLAERLGLDLGTSIPSDTYDGCLCSSHGWQTGKPLPGDESGVGLARRNARFHASSICRSIEYMIASSEHGSLGAMVVIFPLRVAASHVMDCPAVAHWLDKQWKHLSTQEGFDIGSKAMDIANKNP